MASAGWNGGKAKTTQQVKAWFRHNSKDERIAANHSNTDIDKSRTPLNWSYRGLSYKARCAAYDKRMGEIDQGKPGSGKNARTVLQAVCVYSPAALRGDLDKLREWFHRVGELAEAQFGAANVIDMAVDVDEVHEYPDGETGVWRTAAEHGHLWLVPEVDGRLNGKQFSSRAAIIAFNDAIHEMTKKEFDCKWNDGTKQKRRGSVEQMKVQSVKKLEERQEKAEEFGEGIGLVVSAVKGTRRRIRKETAKADEAEEQRRKADERAEAAQRGLDLIHSMQASEVEAHKKAMDEGRAELAQLQDDIKNARVDAQEAHRTHKAYKEAQEGVKKLTGEIKALTASRDALKSEVTQLTTESRELKQAKRAVTAFMTAAREYVPDEKKYGPEMLKIMKSLRGSRGPSAPGSDGPTVK